MTHPQRLTANPQRRTPLFADSMAFLPDTMTSSKLERSRSMPTSSKLTHLAIVSLKLPTKVPALITYAQGIVKGMTGNASFPSPTPTLAAVMQAIANLQAAETAALARTKGAVATRNEARTALVQLLQQLKGQVQ